MNEKILLYLKRYIISFAILGISSWMILFLRDHSSVTDMAVRYFNLADAFTVPGVIMIMAGLLVWVYNMGNFDMIGYGLSRAKNSFIPSPKYKEEKYYDYKQRMEEKRIKGYSFLFISGGIYLIPAVIFNILFYVAA